MLYDGKKVAIAIKIKDDKVAMPCASSGLWCLTKKHNSPSLWLVFEFVQLKTNNLIVKKINKLFSKINTPIHACS